MFLSAGPVSTTTTTTTPSPNGPLGAGPTDTNPAASRRLRGLSLLRNYTQNLHFNNHPSPHASPFVSPYNSPSATTPPNAGPGPTLGPARPSEAQSFGYFPPVIQEEPDPSAAASAASEAASSRPDPSPAAGSKPAKKKEGRRSPTSLMARKKKAASTTPSPAGPEANGGDAEAGPASIAAAAASMGLDGAAVAAGGAAPGDLQHLTGLPVDQMPTIRFIPHQDPRSPNKPSLVFSATSRTLPHADCVIRVGRYSERDVGANPPPHVPSAAPVGFKSKVVSRRHCEFWCSQGQWYVRDVKSSSGTFLNHIRLSQPNAESRPFPVNDGDVVQLGIDFRGGEEQIFRCVKIRIEANRAWQKALNSFNTSTHKRLRQLGNSKRDSDAGSTASTECAICLMSVAPCQSLFVAPCSHVWHFKCIRPILNDPKTYPHFLCPNCRAVTDLEAETDDPGAEWQDGSGAGARDGATTPAPPAPAADAAAVLSDTTTAAPPPASSSSASEAIDIPRAARSTAHDAPSPPGAAPGSAATPVVAATSTLSDDDLAAVASHMTLGGDELRPAISATGVVGGEAGGSAPRPITPGMLSNGAAIAAGEAAEGPLTPRNDAGPFVFDGSAGRPGNSG